MRYAGLLSISHNKLKRSPSEYQAPDVARPFKTTTHSIANHAALMQKGEGMNPVKSKQLIDKQAGHSAG